MVLFKNFLDEAVKMINFMKSWFLDTCLCDISCDKMGNEHKVTKILWVLERAYVQLFWIVSETGCFLFHGTLFFLERPMTNCSELGFGRHFLENEWNKYYYKENT